MGSSSNEEFKHESLQDAEAIVRYLNALSDGFGKNRLVFGSSQQSVEFEPARLIKLDVKAKRKNNKTRITLRFSWKEGEDAPGFIDDPLMIGSDEDLDEDED